MLRPSVFFLNAGIVFDANEVQEHIEEHAVPHSAALLARARETQSPYFTGALARVNASWQNLGRTRRWPPRRRACARLRRTRS